MMAHVDLCSGIGGFALGFQWAGISKPVLFCDIEPWSRKVLAKHWPDVPIAKDVKELANDPDGLIPDCDILTAGYPCQPFSLAGKRRGSEDDRHIWPYIFSIIQAKRPAWCVFENVYGHVSMGLNEVLSDLERKSNYAARPFIVPACATDAPHRRDRVWIIARDVADPRHKGLLQRGKHEDTCQKSVKQSGVRWDGIQGRKQRKVVADTDSKRLQGQWREHEFVSEREAEHSVGSSGEEVSVGSFWEPEPCVGRVANGIPRRVDRIRGLGNAIVPQIAQRIGETIKQVKALT